MLMRHAILLLLALLLAACGGSDDGGSGSKDDSSGGRSSEVTDSGGDGDCDGPVSNEEVDGNPAVRHCGDATAKFTADDAVIEVEGGQCQNTADSFVFNAGTTVLGGGDQGDLGYVGIVAGMHPAATPDAPAVDKDGTYGEGVTVSANGAGKRFALTDAKLELTDDRTKGTFEGTDLATKATVTGEFDCG